MSMCTNVNCLKIRALCFCVIALFLSINVFAQTAAVKSFAYAGKNWEKYEGHLVSIVVLDTSVAGTHLLAEQVIKDGKFNVSGELSYPQNAYFGLYNSKGDYVYKQEFIAEPGKLQLDLSSTDNGLIVEGGTYNPLFIAIKQNPALLKAKADLSEFQRAHRLEDYKIDSIQAKYNDLNRTVNSTQQELYSALRHEHEDPLVRLLAIVNSNSRVSYEQELHDLEKEIGLAPEISYLRYRIEAAKRRNAMRVNVGIGSQILPFSGKDLEGNTTHLTDVLAKNKYTLVEFWASWCGPCRAEIPHLKKAYAKYKDKQFEILSFTLDHDMDRWTQASQQENLPWIDISDLLAYKSPVVMQFGISGIPANYLVDSEGKVVAVNLRGEGLDKKLAELF